MASNGKFYIGRTFDPKKQEVTDNPVLYDPADLTTHGVVVGMTGSGKTGLCIDILEEAALNSIPAILVDPKGDIGNLLLHFPELKPEDFEPWVDREQARREGKTTESLAQEQASLWKKGLAKWGIEPERIQAVMDAVDYAIYTPGSDAGLPVSILASLEHPDLPWDENREILRERISSTVTALLGLVGMDADPMQSREHILLANIFEESWKNGQDLELTSLIQMVQSPPFEKLGALDLEQVYPPKERFALAMSLNNILASPSFSLWIEGEALNIKNLLWTPEGKPRHTIFYLAHLSDAERMFFVTLLLSAIETWVRTESGVTSLRALLYFDEVLGFLPPVANPPSKPPLMRLLKQARAFGFGVLLATQNPIDLDYKALSNAGTWFVGRLQTEQDKNRLLDGLEGVSSNLNRGQVDRMISSLGKRVFLLHNVHEKEPVIFNTRWAMAYLRGPVTRAQVKKLNNMTGASVQHMAETSSAASSAETGATKKKETSQQQTTQPAVPSGVEEVFFPNTVTFAQAVKNQSLSSENTSNKGLVYRPALLAQSSARILNRTSGIDMEKSLTALVLDPDRRGIVRWEKHIVKAVDMDQLERNSLPDTGFKSLEAPLNNASTIKNMQKDFEDYIYRTLSVEVLYNPKLKLFSEPGATRATFRSQCTESAREARDAEIETLRKKYETKITSIQRKLMKEEQELSEDQGELTSRRLEEAATLAENVIGLLGGSRSSRRISTSMTKHRMTKRAKADIDESVRLIESYKKELSSIEAEVKDAAAEVEQKWVDAAAEIEEKSFTPYKKDIFIDLFGISWLPFWQAETDGEDLELPGWEI
ncbi:MAG: ATP-binding protein [Anaerolineales bacterium]|nr:ATP-binding protein [Anaerolineales bacterium]